MFSINVSSGIPRWLILIALTFFFASPSVKAGDASIFATSPLKVQIIAFSPAILNLVLRETEVELNKSVLRSVPTIDRHLSFDLGAPFTDAGRFTPWLAVGINLGRYALMARWHKMYVLVEVVAMSEGVSGILKLLVNRQRPDGSNTHSFPSSHASTMFALASFVGTDLRRQHRPWIFPYLIATFVGLSRVGGKRHYFTDVLGGSVIGSFIGYMLYDYHFDAQGDRKREQRGSGKEFTRKWQIIPLGNSLALSYRF